MQDDANEDCSSRQLQLGHPYVHWHPVRNVTEFYYLCDLDVGVKTYCANGTRSNGARDVVCEVLARGLYPSTPVYTDAMFTKEARPRMPRGSINWTRKSRQGTRLP
ncbi:hypothetical protein HPB47_004241 [Ixodes persulcatus]|uniref:Uncharacterized protein n=1 Tax=Ixodes persulcatus TaxID=34615 RepID=A0AC60PH66_IXOPE|nr:hypothetical protein HPB47_004241 [Ixodes persulcatus]